jgi:hypothetical protein
MVRKNREVTGGGRSNGKDMEEKEDGVSDRKEGEDRRRKK